MQRMTVAMVVTVVAGSLAVVALGAQTTRSAEVALKAAQHQEDVQGDLRGALEEYRKLTSNSDRAIAATALLRLAGVYQKLGDTQARLTYERVVREFADQTAQAAEARTQLSRLHPDGPGRAAGEPRSVWSERLFAHQFGKVSEDGRWLPYATLSTSARPGGLFVHDLRTGVDIRLETSTLLKGEGAQVDYKSVVSRDSRFVAYAYFGRSGLRTFELRVVALDPSGGSRPRVLVANEDIEWILAHDWSPDGKWLAVDLRRRDGTIQIGLVSTEDGTVHVLKSLLNWRGQPEEMAFSRDGKYLAFDVPQPTSARRDIAVLAIDGSDDIRAGREVQAVVHDAHDALLGWSPDGRQLLFASDRGGGSQIWATPFDASGFGAPRRIQAPHAPMFAGKGLTAGGGLYYVTSSSPNQQAIKTASVDFSTGQMIASPRLVTQDFLTVGARPTWSPDGRSLAWGSYRGMPGPHDHYELSLTIRSADGMRELTPALEDVGAPSWSPDGRLLVVTAADMDGRDGIFLVDAGSGEVEPIAMGRPGGQVPSQPQWSVDGKSLFFLRADRNATGDQEAVLVERQVAGGTEQEFPIPGLARVSMFQVSPDRTKVYFRRGCTPTPCLARLIERTLRSGSEREMSTVAGVTTFSPDARHVATVVTTTKNGTMELALQLLSLDSGNARELFRKVTLPATAYRALSVLQWSSDGRSLLISERTPAPEGRFRSVLWWVPIDGRERRQLDFGLDIDDEITELVVHPDGRQVAFRQERSAPRSSSIVSTLWELPDVAK